MNFGLVSTFPKLASVSPMLATCVSPDCRGSLKSTSTRKNIRNTLSRRHAERHILQCADRFWLICPCEATMGPSAPPMFTSV